MKKNSKVLEYEKLPKGSKMKFLEKHRIARSNMSRWRRKKNSHRISRVRDNLSESITGFSPHNISEHVVS